MALRLTKTQIEEAHLKLMDLLDKVTQTQKDMDFYLHKLADILVNTEDTGIYITEGQRDLAADGKTYPTWSCIYKVDNQTYTSHTSHGTTKIDVMVRMLQQLPYSVLKKQFLEG